jgi:hypothetical protein
VTSSSSSPVLYGDLLLLSGDLGELLSGDLLLPPLLLMVSPPSSPATSSPATCGAPRHKERSRTKFEKISQKKSQKKIVPDPDLEFKKKLAMAHQCMVRHYYFPAFKFQKKNQ